MRAAVRDDVIALAIVAVMMLAGLGVLSLITRVKRRIRHQDIQLDPEDTDHREDNRDE